MGKLWAWLQDRTGVIHGWRRVLLEPFPGGARWRHTWLALLAGMFLVQVVTGFFLWLFYSPSTQTAWESVFYLQTMVPGGWVLRGLHHFGAQAFVVMLGVHLLQLVLSRACRVPGEVAYWCGLGLLPLSVGLSVTGWLLPYDQHGYWAARVPLNLLAVTPMVGESLRVVLLGGVEVTHLTLTRFLALHAGLLPVLTAIVLFLHVRLSWRTIRRRVEEGISEESYWPDQAWRDAVVLAAAVGGLVAWVIWRHGAPLGAPANPAEEYAAARPEWFLLWLFQMLKAFRGSTEVWGAVVLPSMLLLLLALTPFTSLWKPGHRANIGFVTLLGAGVVVLTLQAWYQDRTDPVYGRAVSRARVESDRVQALAAGSQGIPPDGLIAVARRDPFLQGPRLFAVHCAGCHRYDGHDGLGVGNPDLPTASDLRGFASRTWLMGLLDPGRVDSLDYFGATKFREGKMVRFVKRDVAGFEPAQKEQLHKVLTALAAEAGLPSHAELDQRDAAIIEEGRRLIDHEDLRCTECHRFRGLGEDPAGPELTGYGSREWLIEFIRDPAHERFYGQRNDRMPRFGAERILDDASIGLIADWLREDWRDP